MIRDRASVVAVAVIALIARRLSVRRRGADFAEVLHGDVAALLRDEFADQRREVLADIYDLPSPHPQ
jgi:hypothetical protein